MSQVEFKEFYSKFYLKPDEMERKRARLFPAFEKKKIIEEDVTSNIFLACLVGIDELKGIFFKEININIGRNSEVHAYTQIDFESQVIENKKDIPDGLLVLTENDIVQKVFLMEFKTASQLERNQIEKYVEIAKKPNYKFNGIITVSNDIVSTPMHNPLNFKSTEAFGFFHYSWIRIQTLLQKVIHTGIHDNDQKYLAKQLLLYLKDHKDIINFNKMNKDWESQAKLIRSSEKLPSKLQSQYNIIAKDWLQEEQDLCLKLNADYSKNIKTKLGTGEEKDIKKRLKSIAERIQNDKMFKTIYTFKPLKNSKKENAFHVTTKRTLEIHHEINLKSRTQSITLEINNPIFMTKKFKSQLKEFVNPFIKDDIPNTNEVKDLIFLEVYIKGTNTPVSNKSFADYGNDMFHGDILKGFDNISSNDIIRKFKITSEDDLAGDFLYSAKFIKKIEKNFFKYFENIIVPFSEN